nr:GNAT family N-acetyltransferase [Deinobacterium chartae]
MLRRASPSDAGLIADLIRRAWAGTVAPESGGHRMTAAKILSRMQRGGGGLILEVAGEPAGSLHWSALEDDPQVWEVMGVGVLPAYRGRDLSARLLGAVEEAARAAGVRELRLAVRRDSTTARLVALYERGGYGLAPQLSYSHANPLTEPPVVLHKPLSQQVKL